MALQLTTTGGGVDVVSSLRHAISDLANEDLSASGKEYLDWGFTELELDLPDEQLQGVAGAGIGILTVEGQKYGSNERWRDYPSSYTLRKYTSELKQTEELDHWFAKRLAVNAKKAMTELRSLITNELNAIWYNVNYDAAQLLFQGTGTSFFTGGDGLSLWNGAHTIRKSGGTQSNLFSDVHRPFNGDNLIEAINRMNRFRNANDVQARKGKRYRVLCSIEDESNVKKTLYSMFGPNNPNLGANAAGADFMQKYRGMTVDSATISYMPTTAPFTTSWGVIDLDRAAERLIMGIGWLPRATRDEEKENGVTEVSLASGFVGPNALGFQFGLWSTGSGLAV